MDTPLSGRALAPEDLPHASPSVIQAAPRVTDCQLLSWLPGGRGPDTPPGRSRWAPHGHARHSQSTHSGCWPVSR